MKKIRVLALISALVLICALFAACTENKTTNKLTISDITVYLNGDELDINPVFSGKEEIISYEYDEFYLQILNGKVKGLEEGEFEVKAKSKNCEATFKVTCVTPLKVDDMYAWVSYPAVDIPAQVKISGEVVYTSDSDLIQINGNLITAVKSGDAVVTAKLGTYETTFNVSCLDVDRTDRLYYIWDGDWNWTNKSINNRAKYNAQGTDGKTTIFIGDSFFDIDFFSIFYSVYRNKDALCLGIGGTTSHTWELFLDETFDGIQPKNVVVQLGNNNIYNDQTLAKDAIEDLERFFTYLHGKMPNSKVYYFAVTPRDGQAAWANEVLKLNKGMEKYCANRDWIVYLDTNDVINSSHLKDGIHLKPENYEIFVDALYDAGIEIEDK